MRIELKAGVELSGLSPQMVMAALVVCSLAEGEETVVVTSGSDSYHSSKSKHYRGDALDFRTRNRPDAEAWAERVKAALGRDFDVILEETHLHVEYDPRRPRAQERRRSAGGTFV